MNQKIAQFRKPFYWYQKAAKARDTYDQGVSVNFEKDIKRQLKLETQRVEIIWVGLSNWSRCQSYRWEHATQLISEKSLTNGRTIKKSIIFLVDYKKPFICRRRVKPVQNNFGSCFRIGRVFQ